MFSPSRLVPNDFDPGDIGPSSDEAPSAGDDGSMAEGDVGPSESSDHVEPVPDIQETFQ